MLSRSQSPPEESDHRARLSSSSPSAEPVTEPSLPASTAKLCRQLNSNLKRFRHSINTLPRSSSSSSLPDQHQLLQPVIQLIQDNNNQALAFLDNSFRRLLADVLESIRTQAILEHCNRQLGELNKQLLINAANLNDEVRARVSVVLGQQKQELEAEKRALLAHAPLQPGARQANPATRGPAEPTVLLASAPSFGPANVHPTLLESQFILSKDPNPSKTHSHERYAFPTHINPNILSSSATPKRPRSAAFEYDEALIDEFSISSNLSRTDYSQKHNQQLSSSIVFGDHNDISVIGNHHGPVPSGSNSQIGLSLAPALAEAPSKSVSGSKSSHRQSAILRNLVSAALGRLIAQVTSGQQTHWPGSDTEERLAAMGLTVDLWPCSKLTREVLHKGPKNLQLQQCKRILLELELGLVRLREIQPIPRPSRLSKKRARMSVSTGPANYDPALVGQVGLGPTKDVNQDLIQKYIQSNLHPSGFVPKEDEEDTVDEDEHPREEEGSGELSD